MVETETSRDLWPSKWCPVARKLQQPPSHLMILFMKRVCEHLRKKNGGTSGESSNNGAYTVHCDGEGDEGEVGHCR